MNRFWRNLTFLCLGVALGMLWVSTVAASVPPQAQKYKADLIRNARFVWGLNAPIATFAAQVHQESAWRPDAKSPYAGGLAQFTPDTAEWIGGVYPELAERNPFNPAWALRALVRYDLHLYDRIAAVDECNRWAFTLSAYNGGLGWVNRDKVLARANGYDPDIWWNSVEMFSKRAGWAMRENRDYPRRILLQHQPKYLGWGPGVECK
jgi:membrane-bound lytic murein transglycosylase MltF